MNFSFLDYIWRGLTVSVVSSSLLMLILFVATKLVIGHISFQFRRSWAACQIATAISIFITTFACIICVDPDLASGCFQIFTRNNSIFTFTRVIALSWFCTTVLLMVKDLYIIWSFSLRTPLEPIQNIGEPRLLQLFEEVREKMGMSQGVSLALTSRSISPFACGIFNPKVVLPRHLISCDAQTLSSIFAHELSHIQNRDFVWKVLSLIFARIMFFNPLVGAMNREFSLAMELAADEMALRKLELPVSAYANSMLGILQMTSVGGATLAIQPQASTGFVEMKRRLVALSNWNHQSPSDIPYKSSKVFIFGAFILSVGFSLAHAQSTVRDISGTPMEHGMMCSQVRQEKLIESWLRVSETKKQCDK